MARRLVPLFALISLVLGEPLLLPPPCEVSLRTEAGLVCGRLLCYNTTTFASFLNVPYAKQPLGELRFQELQPAEKWTGYLDATTEGPICPQQDVFYGDVMQPRGMSEACIHANIFVPVNVVNQLQPDSDILSVWSEPKRVLVMVHGGGFAFGSADPDLYGPEYLMEKDTIVVTFNYRLGPFGFLSLNSPEVPGNQGLRDIVTLLKWVKRNAPAFCGDPDDVTLVGQSAGAVAAHMLSMSTAGQGLFKRVILMSGVAERTFTTSSPAFAKYISGKFLELLKINVNDTAEIHRQLIEMPLDDIMAANKVLLNASGVSVFFPVVESDFEGVTRIIDREPEELLLEGRGKDVPLMIGFTEAECESFRYRFTEIDVLDRVVKMPALLLPVSLLYRLSPDKLGSRVAAIKQQYFSRSGMNMDAYVQLCTDSYFMYPAMFLARHRALMGAANTYLYQFSYQGRHRVLERPGYAFKGAAHVEDLTYVFKTNSKPDIQDYTDRLMQKWMADLFVAFMSDKKPQKQYLNYTTSENPEMSEDFLLYQDLRTPYVHKITPPTDHQREAWRFFDQMYSED